ncbi:MULTISPECIES: recombinase family protein [Vibrio]|uniref:recombinase family protein n=1 Tax=Vibrio TaxID=662 RepID=UPI00207632AC|nr:MULTISPECIES: recombinase family protein [Vibrio]USD34757.1 recombinase family protein [Vibrio sp. SCSIO 43186]USD47823.1 recombinase family protein [Vibrio sp. SCSIO 43145]USD71882.1 recombinase family protein [Vibrio sp. SCSIO 43139]USD97542.1 recombinase [Vibrio coralliilyticus]
MTVYLYSRFSPKNQAYSQHLEQMQAAAPEAIHFQDKVYGYIPPMERPEFVKLFNVLKANDTVVVWWLSVFGHDFSQALHVVERLYKKGVNVQTVCEPLRLEPNTIQGQTLLSLLSGYGQVQTQHRLFAAEMGRKQLKENPELWKQKFRGRPADKQKHRQIAELLMQGETLQNVTEQCGVSLSTVKRVKAKLQSHDDEGCLKRRVKGQPACGENDE